MTFLEKSKETNQITNIIQTTEIYPGLKEQKQKNMLSILGNSPTYVLIQHLKNKINDNF